MNSIPFRAALVVGIASTISMAVAAELSGRRDDAPLHELVLDYLRVSTDVVPEPLPETHPFRTVFNKEAIIPPQCYTKTEGQHNPCYVCHQNAVPQRENTMNDGDLQLAYSFSDVGMTNHWNNLFEDRSSDVAAISDQAIMEWVNQENYSELPGRLEAAGFEGWIPDLEGLELAEKAFDEHGFALDGSHWVAFNYKPLPSTFWPTNGSTDDVMIRLPAEFRTDTEGNASRDVYVANLSILEASIKGYEQISTPPIDERIVGVDLDADGELGVTALITDVEHYVGAAAGRYRDTYLYPTGTEFLHTVRYLGISSTGDIAPSPRMKEVRYMRKWQRYPKVVYQRQYQLEGFAKEIGQLPQYKHLGDYGLDNGFGWSIQGFIEDRQGRLRAGTYEETLFCMGCHTSIGATIDKTFSFARKVDGAAGWGYIDLKDMPDATEHGRIRR